MGRNTFGVLIAAAVLSLWPLAATAAFHLEEATIADIHRAIIAKELTATELVDDIRRTRHSFSPCRHWCGPLFPPLSNGNSAIA